MGSSLTWINAHPDGRAEALLYPAVNVGNCITAPQVSALRKKKLSLSETEGQLSYPRDDHGGEVNENLSAYSVVTSFPWRRKEFIASLKGFTV
jgi:hypothetical protein